MGNINLSCGNIPMVKKMKVEFEEGCDPDAVVAEMLKVAKKVEPDFEII